MSILYASARPCTHANTDRTPVYVVFFYVVWQILTRSDDGEILEHLPPTSPLLSSASHSPYERSAPSHQPYQLPYALQHIPSPIPSTNAESTSTWRMVLGTMVYPIYIAVTLIAIPLPFLINAFNLLMSIVNSILYPITSTFRLLARTFVIAPLTVVLGFLNALYPVYVFVGGIVGAGAFLGVAFGWIGRVLLSFILRPRSTPRRRKSQRSKSKRNSSSSARAPSTEPKKAPEPVYTSTPHSKRHSMPPQPTDYSPVKHSTSRSRPTSGSYERRYVPIVDVIELDDGAYLPYEQSHTTARPGVVFGVRRRGTRG